MSGTPPGADRELEELASYLKALGHPSRLELLRQLRIPRSVGEIRLRPHREEQEGNPDRLISRTAVERHLLSLTAIGVVVRRAGERDGRPVDEYVLQQQRLFQVIEEMRELAQLRPLDPVGIDATVQDQDHVRPIESKHPHVVLLTGPFEGRTVELSGEGPWTLGRAAPAQVLLDYDPYVSTAHARIERRGDAFQIEDLPSNRNGTFVNWSRLRRGAARPLRAGDVVRAGRSLLLFRQP